VAIEISKWNLAKEYFEAGLSLSEITDKTGISKSQISKKANSENWKKGNEKKQLIIEAIKVQEKKETLNETALNVHNEIVEEYLRSKDLIFKSTLKNISMMAKKLNDGSTIAEHKLAQDTIDKASLTLGVNQRHSNTQVSIENQNQQNTPTQIIFSDI